MPDTNEEKALADLHASIDSVAASDNVVDEETNLSETEVAEESPRELSDFEKEQQLKGWNPNGEKSAEEWLAAQPLYDEIKRRGKEIKQLKRTMDKLKEMVERAEQVAYEKAVAELSAHRDHAVQTGNSQAVVEIDDRIKQLEPTKIEEMPEAVAEFVDRHSEWLNGTSWEHMRMAKFTRERDAELGALNMGPEEHMRVLEEHVKKEFPEYFGEVKIHKRNTVESGQDQGIAKKGKKVYTINDLSPEQKKCVYDFERNNIMPREKYIQMLADAGELE